MIGQVEFHANIIHQCWLLLPLLLLLFVVFFISWLLLPFPLLLMLLCLGLHVKGSNYVSGPSTITTTLTGTAFLLTFSCMALRDGRNSPLERSLSADGRPV